MQQNNKDLNGTGTQKDSFFSFLSLRLMFLLLHLTFKQRASRSWKKLCYRDSYMNKILRVAIITTSSSNFIKCLQKKKENLRAESFKQKAH